MVTLPKLSLTRAFTISRTAGLPAIILSTTGAGMKYWTRAALT